MPSNAATVLLHYRELLATLAPPWREPATAALSYVIETRCEWDWRRGEDAYFRPIIDQPRQWGEGAARVLLKPLVVTGDGLRQHGVSPRALKALGAPRSAGRIAKKLRIENCAEITWEQRVLWGFGNSGVVIDLAAPNVIYHRHKRGDFNPPAWFTRHV